MRPRPLALALALSACAPAPVTTVVFIGPAPPDTFRDDAPTDAVEALNLALELSIPPEAMIPVAGYLSAAHARMHAAFAEGALRDFEHAHPNVAGDLVATLDLSLAEADGRVVDLGLSRTSGFEAFDATTIVGALRASPFGAPPHDIVGSDARAHLSWPFHRRAADPCALANAVAVRGAEP